MLMDSNRITFRLHDTLLSSDFPRIEAKYVAQPLKQTWNNRVEQYVLGIGMKEVWDELRREAGT